MLVVDDITGICQPQNSQGQSVAHESVSLTSVAFQGNRPKMSDDRFRSGSFQNG